MSRNTVKEHLKDIDFRTREARQKDCLNEFKKWYDELYERQLEEYSDLNWAQMSILSAILWHLMDKKSYKEFMSVRKQTNERTRSEQLL